MIRLIRAAPDPNAAREALLSRSWPAEEVADLIALIDEPGHKVAEDGTYRLSEAQARAILDLRLQRLTGLEREKIADELKALATQILDLLDILGDQPGAALTTGFGGVGNPAQLSHLPESLRDVG